MLIVARQQCGRGGVVTQSQLNKSIFLSWLFIRKQWKTTKSKWNLTRISFLEQRCGPCSRVLQSYSVTWHTQNSRSKSHRKSCSQHGRGVQTFEAAGNWEERSRQGKGWIPRWRPHIVLHIAQTCIEKPLSLAESNNWTTVHIKQTFQLLWN